MPSALIQFIAASGCKLEPFLIAWTLILSVFITILSILERVAVNNRGGLLPAATLTLYGTWLLYSALSDNPSTCNRVSQSTRTNNAHIIIGFLISSLSITWASYSLFIDFNRVVEPSARASARASSSRSNSADGNAADKDANTNYGVAPDGSSNDDEDDDADEVPALDEQQCKQYGRFHLIMIAASMYMCMLLSNWGAPPSNDENQPGTVSRSNLWLNMTSQWIAFLIYTWTLIGPILLTDRDWS